MPEPMTMTSGCFKAAHFEEIHQPVKRPIDVILEKHRVACDMLHGFSWDRWTGKMSNDEFGMAN